MDNTTYFETLKELTTNSFNLFSVIITEVTDILLNYTIIIFLPSFLILIPLVIYKMRGQIEEFNPNRNRKR